MSTGPGVLRQAFRERKKEFLFLLLCALLPLAGLLPQHIFDWIVSFPLVGIYLAAAYLAGTAVLYGLRIFEDNRQLLIIIRILFGFGVFSLYFLLLGVLGLARHLIFAYVVLILLLSGYVVFRKTIVQKGKKTASDASAKKKIKVEKKEESPTVRGLRIVRWSVYFLIFIIIAAVFIIAPIPEGFHDSLLYHLAVPQQMFITGSLAPMENNFTTYLPLNSEMLYLPLAASDYAARLLQFVFALMTAGLIFFSVPKKHRMLAGIVCICGFAYFEFLRASVTVLPEMNVAAYALGGWLLLEQYADKRQMAFLFTAGAMFGFAAGTKYQGLVIAVVSAAAYIFLAVRRKQGVTKTLALAGLLILVTVIVFLPWMMRSIIHTGDPVFPAGYSIFGAKNISEADINTILSIWNYKSPEASGIGGFFTAPFKQITEAGGTAMPLFFLLPLPFVFLKRKDGFAGPAIALLGFYIAWWLLAPHPRYFVPAIPLILLIGARSIQAFEVYKKIRLIYIIAAVLIFVFNFIPSLASFYKVIRPFEFYKSGLDRAAYEERLSASPFAAFNFINENTPKASRILLIGESRGYNLKRPNHACSPYERQLVTNYLEKYQTAGEMKSSLKSAGYDYILVNYAEWQRTRDMLKIPAMDFAPRGSREGKLFIEFIRSLATVFADKRCVVYSL